MANKTRKTRAATSAKTPTVRFRFETAANAKAVEERMNVKSTVGVVRTGRTLTLAETGFKALDRAATAEGVSGSEVGQRGRPKAGEAPQTRTAGVAAGKKTRRPADDVDVNARKKKATKAKGTDATPKKPKMQFVVLTPSPADATKLAKALEAKRDGARVIINGVDEATARAAIKSVTRKLEIPTKLESGFTKKAKPQLDKADRFSKLDKLPKTVLGRRPKSKKVKRPSERTKPVVTIAISSSTLTRAWYNFKTNALTLEFKNGSRYRYAKVSLKEFTAFVLADSQGVHFTENFKDVKETTKLKARPKDRS